MVKKEIGFIFTTVFKILLTLTVFVNRIFDKTLQIVIFPATFDTYLIVNFNISLELLSSSTFFFPL